MEPPCRIVPKTAGDVLSAVRHLIAANTTFAVASGGHSSNAGASNVEGGVTIDLASLNEVTLVEDETAVWLGPGARWQDVYSALEPYNLVVSGGRVAHVGVGGYVLGGGFSWFSNEFGWTCDSVLAFEVVTPAGSLLPVDKVSHAELFWALKGTLGAFGIVTRMEMPTIRNDAVFGGGISYGEPQLPAAFSALQELASNAEEHLAIQGYLSFGYSSEYQHWGHTVYLIDTAPYGNHNASITTFRDIPHVYDSLRNTTIGDSAREIADSNPLGFSRAKFTLTTNCSAETMRLMYDIIRRDTLDLESDQDLFIGATFQPLTVPHLNRQDNALNLGSEESALLLVSFEFWWKDASLESHYQRRARSLHKRLRSSLVESRALHRFVYPNYAAEWQNPFGDLAPSSQARLERVKSIYDPDDIWRALRPGIWHIAGRTSL